MGLVVMVVIVNETVGIVLIVVNIVDAVVVGLVLVVVYL